MSWIALTVADLEDARAAELVAALREEALGDGQTDPFPRLAQMVVDEVRRCIAYCTSTPLDADATTIPAGLKELVVAKLVRVMKARLLQPLSDDEKDAERLYQKRLEQLTRCEWPVDAPSTPIAVSPVAPATGVELAAASARAASRESLGGL